MHALQDKLRMRTAQIFRNLTSWQVLQLARHPSRPYTADYIRVMFDEFRSWPVTAPSLTTRRSWAAWPASMAAR